MSWKTWPSWLKGGVIGLGVGLILGLFGTLAASLDLWTLVDNKFFQLLIGFTICSNILSGEVAELFCVYAFDIIINLIIFFGIGALIGWLVGRNKK